MRGKWPGISSLIVRRFLRPRMINLCRKSARVRLASFVPDLLVTLASCTRRIDLSPLRRARFPNFAVAARYRATKDIRQGRVWTEPREQAVAAIALRGPAADGAGY